MHSGTEKRRLVRAFAGAGEKAPLSSEAEMPRRPPAVTGQECAAASREFRWNRGSDLIRPEPLSIGLGRFFAP